MHTEYLSIILIYSVKIEVNVNLFHTLRRDKILLLLEFLRKSVSLKIHCELSMSSLTLTEYFL